jgi:hypothetical protein
VWCRRPSWMPRATRTPWTVSLPTTRERTSCTHTHGHTPQRAQWAWRESRYVPVLVTGFEGLRERVQKQDELRDGHKAALHQISGNVDRLRAELQARVLTKLSERQQQHRALVQRMLEVRPHTASARACVCVNLFLSLTRGTGGQAAGDGATAAHARLGGGGQGAAPAGRAPTNTRPTQPGACVGPRALLLPSTLTRAYGEERGLAVCWPDKRPRGARADPRGAAPGGRPVPCRQRRLAPASPAGALGGPSHGSVCRCLWGYLWRNAAGMCAGHVVPQVLSEQQKGLAQLTHVLNDDAAAVAVLEGRSN